MAQLSCVCNCNVNFFSLNDHAKLKSPAHDAHSIMPTLYGLNTCDSCKKARQWLDCAGIAHTFIDYRSAPPSPQMLDEWAQKRGGFAALVNTSSTTWRQLPQARKTPTSDAQWSALLREYPALIKRPLLVMDDARIHQGFKETDFKTLFGVAA